ncbi:AAA family ATPase [Paraglaciecola aestuariivivens]
MSSWESIFLGREAELQQLNKIWEKAKTGEPQLAVLLGETGLGKTRIVQQFYRHLASTQSPQDNAYWPPSLNVGRNLSLQPEILNPKAEIPWLWWSMRFPEPESRNTIPHQSPFEAYDRHLAANAEPILRKRNVKQSNVDASLAFTSIIADIASVGLVGNTLALFELYKTQRSAKKNATLDMTELLAKRVEELVDKTLSALRLFLDSSQKDAPSIPVVLVLDDAQWIDPISLHALFLIVNEAEEKNWPLIVLCTHWAKEWHEFDSHCTDYDFENLKQLTGYFGKKCEQSAHILSLSKLQNSQLEHIVKKALPYIETEEQLMLVSESDGNPRAMEEMLRLLLDKPQRHFIDGDPQQGLSSQGKNKLAKLKNTSLYTKINERFDDLDDDIQQILMTGALFGAAFQRPLVLDLIEASEAMQTLSDEHSAPLFSDAESIHVLIQTFSETGHEFQQKVYQTVALNYLKEEWPDKFSSLNQLFNLVVDQWLAPDKLNMLSTHDQMQICEYAISYMADATNFDDINISARAYAFEALIDRLFEQNKENQLALKWFSVLDNKTNIPKAFFEHLVCAPQYLNLCANLESTRSQELTNFAHEIAHSLYTAKDERYFSESSFMWSMATGELYQTFINHPELAKKHYTAALDIAKTRNKNSQTAKHLRHIGLAIDKQAELALEVEGDVEKAHFLYKESLEINFYIVEKFGDTPEILSNISTIQERLADMLVEKDPQTAGKLYMESMEKLEHINDVFGESPEQLRGIWVKQNKMADVLLQKYGEAQLALELYQSSLSLSRTLVQKYGDTPQRQRDISVCLNSMAIVSWRLSGDVNEFEKWHQESLNIRRNIIQKFGETPERLSDLALILHNYGEVLLQVEEVKTSAFEWFKQSLSEINKLESIYGLSAENEKLKKQIQDKIELCYQE